MDCAYASDMPYPEIETAVKNPYEVRLLMSAYGGKGSETTAIMEYAYQSYILKDKEPEISKCLEEIAITEMRHHDLLGVAITKLGGVPYIGGNNGFWQGGFVNYAMNLKEIINIDIIGEKSAIRGYKDIIRLSKNEEVKRLIARIIVDEEIHVDTLQRIKQTLE